MRWRQSLSVAAVAGLAFAACTPVSQTASPSSAPPGAPASAPAAAQRGAGGELRIVAAGFPATTLNSHLGAAGDVEPANLILEALAAWGPDAKAVPRLASEIPSVENGDVTPDLKTVTWKLKPDVKWSDGSAFSADDVAFTWEYMCSQETAATTAGNCPLIESVKATDANTVVVTLTEPSANFLGLFGVGAYQVIIQKNQFQDCMGAKARDCPANNNPIGTGPYKVKEFKPGDVVTYDINDNYRDPNKPYFKTVSLSGSGDAESAARAVCQTGEIDYAYYTRIPADLLQPMLDAPDSKCQFNAPYNVAEWVHINLANPDPSLGDRRSEPDTKHPFLTDIHVRRALSMATNRVAMQEQLYGKGAEPFCNQTIRPRSTNTDSMDVCKYDLAAAEKELEDNGWTKGADGVREKGGVKLVLDFRANTNAVRQSEQAILKADWEKIGFRVNIGNSPGSTFFSTTAPDSYTKFYYDLAMWADFQEPDPTKFLARYICSNVAAKANNWSGNNVARFCDPEYEKLFDAFSKETDPAKRDEAAIAANDYLVKNVVAIPLLNIGTPFDTYSKKLKNVDPSPYDSSYWNIANWTE